MLKGGILVAIIIDLILVAVILFFVILSAKRGFVKIIVEFVGLIAAVVLAFSLSAPISNFTYDKAIEPTIIKTASAEATENTQQLVEKTWNSLPDFITANSERLSLNSEQFSQNITENMQEGTEVAIKNLSQQIIKPAAVKVIGLFVTVILMVVLFFIVKVLAKLINGLFSFSVVGKLNRTLGGVIGAFKGIVFAMFLCLVISFIVSLTKNGFLIFTVDNINKSVIFKFFTEIIPFNKFILP